MDDHQLSYMIKKKKRKKKGWNTIHKLDMKEFKKTKATIPSSYIHIRYLCHVWWEKKNQKKSHSFKLHIYRLLMSYLGLDGWAV